MSRAEIISVGTELLMGQTINTNAAFLGEEFQSIGLDCYFHTTVGDNEKRIHAVIENALNRSDILVFTGGLGPTTDDLTHESIYSFFKLKSEIDKVELKKLENKFTMRGYKKMPANNKKQAYKPKIAKWIINKNGTANGIILNLRYKGENKTIFTFPGVPSEMKEMWKIAKVYLAKKFGKNIIYSQTLKYTGIGESALAEKINHFFDGINPSVAPYASLGEVKIRVSAKAKTKKQAMQLTQKTANKIAELTKEHLFSMEDESLEEVVSKLLIKKHKTIAVAESCTGGLVSKMLTDIRGSSKYFSFSAITYSNESKEKVLGVRSTTLKKYGAVSREVASEMAKGIKEKSGADIGLSVTGIAGPGGGTKQKPVGNVCFGIAYGKTVETYEMFFGERLSRSGIRKLASLYVLNLVRKKV